MILTVPFRWSEPSTWPWLVWVWIAFMLAGWVKPAWNAYRRRREASWPSVLGRIESAEISDPKRVLGLTISQSPTYRGVMTYSYGVQGNTYSGSNRRTFADREEAVDFFRDLKGRPITVQYNPAKPEVSAITEASLQDVLKSRSPDSAATAPVARAVPLWATPFLWLFAGVSLIGLGLSLYVHINAYMGHGLSPLFWGLHVGIFVVWFPAVLVANRRVGKRRGRDLWKVVLNGAPAWMLYVLYALFANTFISFFLLMGDIPDKSSGLDNPAQWRGFSGTWMIFYFAAFAILYAAAKDVALYCVNGHVVQPGTSSCPQCGQAVFRQ